MNRPSFSIGIEEEYQTIDPETRDLRSHIQSEILPKAKLATMDRAKPELHQAVVEVGTRVCRDIEEAREDILDLRRQMITLASESGMWLAAASTHPFADWRAQDIYPDDRYKQVVEDLQLVARANLVFGLHIHVGIEDRNTAIHIMNSMRYFLPHILALSSNSPFWEGMKTGFKSYRSKVFERFPRTNIPDVYANWAEYETFINLLVKTNCVDNGKKVWWDIRPHPFFNTLEVRVCDIPMRLDETMAIAALIQATVGMLYDLHAKEQELSHLQPRPHYGKQVPRRPLWHRWQADRLRQRRRGADARPDARIYRPHFRCGEGPWLRARHRLYSRDAPNGNGRRPATQGLRRNRRSKEGGRLHCGGDACGRDAGDSGIADVELGNPAGCGKPNVFEGYDL